MDGVWTSEQIASAFFAIDLLWACAFGLVIFQEMKFTLRILYSSIIHMVINGQHVSKGQIILRMGNSGNSGGTHLHFSLFKNNIAIDPTLYIPLDYPRSF